MKSSYSNVCKALSKPACDTDLGPAFAVPRILHPWGSEPITSTTRYALSTTNHTWVFGGPNISSTTAGPQQDSFTDRPRLINLINVAYPVCRETHINTNTLWLARTRYYPTRSRATCSLSQNNNPLTGAGFGLQSQSSVDARFCSI